MIDMPGLDEESRNCKDLISAAEWMQDAYEKGLLFSGVIYLHDIGNVRISSSSSRSFRMFRKLCGPISMKNVLLVTSKWDTMKGETDQGALRERELCRESKLWGSMVQQGATVDRFDNDAATALKFVRKLVSNTPSVLQIQKQLGDERKVLADTDAGKDMNEELSRIKSQYQKEVDNIEQDIKEHRKYGKLPMRLATSYD